MHYHTLKKGFTLVELLIVISIIALLSSVVITNVTDARTEAHVTTFQAQMQDVDDAFVAYRSETGDYPQYLNNISSWTGGINGKTAFESDIQELIDAGYLTDHPNPDGLTGNIDYLFYHPQHNNYDCDTVPGNQKIYVLVLISPRDLDGQFPKLIHRASGNQVASGHGKYYCAHIPTENK